MNASKLRAVGNSECLIYQNVLFIRITIISNDNMNSLTTYCFIFKVSFLLYVEKDFHYINQNPPISRIKAVEFCKKEFKFMT